MPELPEVETVRLGLLPALEGHIITKAIVRRGDLRIPFPPRFAERLTGRRVERLTRRAKYILAALDSGETLVIHLGMSGRMSVFSWSLPLARTLLLRQSRASSAIIFMTWRPPAPGRTSMIMWCWKPMFRRASFSTIIAASA